MKTQIEHEIERTLSCLDTLDEIQVSPEFQAKVRSRVSRLRPRRFAANQSRAFYPMAFLLMISLTLMTLVASFHTPVSEAVDANTLAGLMLNEYGLGQSSHLSF